jgi:hypothetical protein
VRGVREVAVPELLPDLAGVLVLCGEPLGVAAEARGISDPQLLRHVRHRLGGNVQRVRQEGAEETDRAELHGEAEAVVVAPASVHELPIDVVEEEVGLQLRPPRWPSEPAVGRDLVVAEELDGHAPLNGRAPPGVTPARP